MGQARWHRAAACPPQAAEQHGRHDQGSSCGLPSSGSTRSTTKIARRKSLARVPSPRGRCSSSTCGTTGRRASSSRRASAASPSSPIASTTMTRTTLLAKLLCTWATREWKLKDLTVAMRLCTEALGRRPAQPLRPHAGGQDSWHRPGSTTTPASSSRRPVHARQDDTCRPSRPGAGWRRELNRLELARKAFPGGLHRRAGKPVHPPGLGPCRRRRPRAGDLATAPGKLYAECAEASTPPAARPCTAGPSSRTTMAPMPTPRPSTNACLGPQADEQAHPLLPGPPRAGAWATSTSPRRSFAAPSPSTPSTSPPSRSSR